MEWYRYREQNHTVLVSLKINILIYKKVSLQCFPMLPVSMESDLLTQLYDCLLHFFFLNI